MGREENKDKTLWKANYFLKLEQMFTEYNRCFIVNQDNVGSKQMNNIRLQMRPLGNILMGKKTRMRKAIRGMLDKNPSLEKLLPHIQNNVGFVFAKNDLNEVRELILQNKVKAPARPGAIAPCEVTIPPQNTGLGPEKTSFFQALQIPTKISKGTIEIINQVKLLNEGEKVGASEATLLNMLNISPFSYGLVIEMVYDSGSCFHPSILDIKPEDIREKFIEGVMNVAGLCLAVGYPTIVSVPHSMLNGFKNLLAIAAVTDIEFKEAETLKEYLKDPSKFAAAAAASAPAVEEKKEEAAAAPVEESESEDDDMGFGLFD